MTVATERQTQELMTRFDQAVRHSFAEVKKDIEHMQMMNLILVRKVMMMEKKLSDFESVDSEELITREDLEEALEALKTQLVISQGKKGKLDAMKEALISFFTEEISDYPQMQVPVPR